MTTQRPDIMTVLLVEDTPPDVELFQHHVAGLFSVIHASTLNEAESILGAVNPPKIDIIALDPGLPDARGLQALDTLHAVAPDIPILVFTITMDGYDAVEAMQAGASAVVMKQEVERLSQLLRQSVMRARTLAASVLRRQAAVESELQRERGEHALAEEQARRLDAENALLRERLAPSSSANRVALLVRWVVVIVAVTLVSISAIYISRPGENNVPIVTAILGFVVPTVGALLAAALGQTHSAVNGRLSELLNVTAENAAARERSRMSRGE